MHARSKFLIFLIALLGAVSVASAAGQQPSVTVKWGRPLEIGRANLLFASIISICEDASGDFYVLDRLDRTVLKFSPDGRLRLRFGRKGQGPGDFQSPSRIAVTPAEELAVLEDLSYVSFHRTDGVFLRRLDLNGRLGLGYVGPDRYYGWEWRPDGQRQLIVDAKNAILETFHSLARESFSVLLPDETGRAVMFNYDDESYVPRFLFAHGEDLSAVGISDTYEIALLDGQGRSVKTLSRDVPPRRITARERDILLGRLGEFARTKGWPERVARELGRKIPAVKTLLRAVLVSPRNVLVFRTPADIAADTPRYPVDVFLRDGAYQGTTELGEIPLFISASAMYFSRSDADGNAYLVRWPYSF
jgi:hypothetical protein